MALSGSNTWDVQSAGGWLKIKMEWSATQSISGNYSDVTVKVYIVRGAYGYNTNSTADAQSLWINGTKHTGTSSIGGANNTTSLIMQKTQRVNHNADGTKSFKMQFQKYFGLTWVSTWIGTQTFPEVSYTLNTIPRASSISSISGGALGSPVTVNINRASDNFTHTVYYKRTDGQSFSVATGAGKSATFTPALSDANFLPKATSGTATIIVDTYSGTTKIGSTSKTFTVTVPSSVVPTIDTKKVEETVAGLAAQFGAYVQNKSKIKATMTASGAYSSTISSYKITANAETFNAATGTTGFLKTSGTNRVNFEVTDSRGRKATSYIDISVTAYENPKILSVSAIRVNEDGTTNDEGTYAKISFNASVAPVGNKNTKAFIVKYKQSGTPTWTEVDVTGTTYNMNTYTVIADFNIDYTYDIQLYVADWFTSITFSPTPLPSEFTLINYHPSGKALAFGEVSDGSGFDVALPTHFKKGVLMDGGISAPNLPTGDDSITYWRSIFNPFYFVTPNTVANQPSNYGMLLVMRTGNEFNGIWFTQPSGSIYRKSGNANVMSAWIQLH